MKKTVVSRSLFVIVLAFVALASPALPAAASAPAVPALALDRYSGPPNSQVWLYVTGFPAYAPVNIWLTPANAEARLVTQGLTDARGRFTVRLLAEGAPGSFIVFSALGPYEEIVEARFTLTAGAGGGAVETDVTHITSISGVNVRSGPGLRYPVIGWLRAGETAEVTGMSADRQWWQFRCGQGNSGVCWASARRDLTQPVQGDGSYGVFSTNVGYAQALVDVNIRTGPGLTYPAVGKLFAGQIARVTGVDARGEWWQIDCPDDSQGSCWMTAKPRYTQPVDPNQ